MQKGDINIVEMLDAIFPTVLHTKLDIIIMQLQETLHKARMFMHCSTRANVVL